MRVETEDGSFNCVVEGEGEALLLLHGVSKSHAIWRNVVQHLDGGFRLVMPDLLGHGESSRPRRLFPVQEHARSVFAVLDALGLDRVTIVGNSMGAQIGLEMAAIEPHRVPRLVTVGCPAWGTEKERLNYLEIRSPGINADGMPRCPGDKDLSGSDEREADFAPATQDRINMGIGYLNSVWAIANYDVVPRLHHITAQCLVVYGDDDWLLPTSSTLVRGLHRVSSATIEKGGHVVPLQKPRELASVLNEFLVGSTAPDR